MLKRTIDVVAACTGLVLLAPLLVMIAIAVRLDSRGPVFFCQRRIGMAIQPFEVIKFRTMAHREHVDQHAERVIEGNTDARITRTGRLLRVTSLDELPQLINVLRGEMSLVGPRPILPEQLEVVPEAMMRRFDVRPGITGLAQVKGRRSLDWMEQLAYDAEYARNPGAIRDLRILVRTVVVVLRGSGVYADASKNWRAYRPGVSSDKEVQEKV